MQAFHSTVLLHESFAVFDQGISSLFFEFPIGYIAIRTMLQKELQILLWINPVGLRWTDGVFLPE
jgi:hypothetical protein